MTIITHWFNNLLTAEHHFSERGIFIWTSVNKDEELNCSAGCSKMANVKANARKQLNEMVYPKCNSEYYKSYKIWAENQLALGIMTNNTNRVNGFQMPKYQWIFAEGFVWSTREIPG